MNHKVKKTENKQNDNVLRVIQMHDNIQAAEWGLRRRELKAYVALVLWWEKNKKNNGEKNQNKQK